MTHPRSWALTDTGAVRRHNEDNLLARPELGLWAVADGAGGHESGELASGMIVEALERLPAALDAGALVSSVRLAVAEVHAALRAEARRRGGNAMVASTLVCLMIRNQHFACLWAGDSRGYLLRGGALRQITHDHSLVQELVDSGALQPEEAERHPHANVITRAVGADDDGLELDKVTGQALPGDRFLLCSDGLSKTLDEAEIRHLLGAPPGMPPTELLVGAALARGANDNVTAIVVEI